MLQPPITRLINFIYRIHFIQYAVLAISLKKIVSYKCNYTQFLEQYLFLKKMYIAKCIFYYNKVLQKILL